MAAEKTPDDNTAKRRLCGVFAKASQRKDKGGRGGQGGGVTACAAEGADHAKAVTALTETKPAKPDPDAALTAAEDHLKAQRQRTADQDKQLDVYRRRREAIPRRGGPPFGKA